MKNIKGGIAAGLRLGNLGFKMRGLTPMQVIEDADYFAEILVRNKMIGFIGLNPSDEEFSEIMRRIYRGGNKPEELRPGFLFDQTHAGNQNTTTEEVEWFINSQWHMDNPFFELIPSYTALRMDTFTCSPNFGQTHFYSLVNAYRDCPEDIKELLKTTEFINETGLTRNGPGGSGAHPALRTHPVTGETMLLWSGHDMRMADGTNPEWFQRLNRYMQNQLLSPELRYSWSWNQGDVVIWDNRSVLHSFSPGWEHDQRIFTRCEVGNEKPFFNEEHKSIVSDDFGDTWRKEGVAKDETTGPNPDHIPLVFTKGIYAIPEYSDLFQKVTMFVYCYDGNIPDDVLEFQKLVGNSDFNVVGVEPLRDENKKYDSMYRFSNHYLLNEPLIGQKFLFTKNGDLERAFSNSDDLFRKEPYEDGRPCPVELIGTLVELHPDMRHAGHAWHYPCWFPHQRNLKFRPWDWHNLSFFEYEQFNGGPPPFDFLVQFAVDTVYGCFNHISVNDERKKLIEAVIDYMQYMIELGEHESDR
jgi:alpha-ketoglutarate-dependent taurine dioxygenase